MTEKHYLGLDLSTQSATGVLLAADLSVLRFESVPFADLAGAGGVLQRTGAQVRQSPVLWLRGLHELLKRLASGSPDLRQVVAVAGSAQQHGTVYLKRDWTKILAHPDWLQQAASLLPPVLTEPGSPIWMDGSTAEERREITAALGGAAAAAELLGAVPFERYSGVQMRAFHKRRPEAYADTARIHLVGSFIASCLLGKDAPLNEGDASGTALWSLTGRRWSEQALAATAPDLRRRLPETLAAGIVLGPTAAWTAAYGLRAELLGFDGDNPATVVGCGLTEPATLLLSLGTSDTEMLRPTGRRSSGQGRWVEMIASDGAPMLMHCAVNGGLSREKVAAETGLVSAAGKILWDEVGAAAEKFLRSEKVSAELPFVEREIGFEDIPAGRKVLGNPDLEPQLALGRFLVSQALVKAWIVEKMGLSEPDFIVATGGASLNYGIMSAHAAAFNTPVLPLNLPGGAGAAFGAAVRAWRARHRAPDERQLSWQEVGAAVRAKIGGQAVPPPPPTAALTENRRLLEQALVLGKE